MTARESDETPETELESMAVPALLLRSNATFPRETCATVARTFTSRSLGVVVGGGTSENL